MHVQENVKFAWENLVVCTCISLLIHFLSPVVTDVCRPRRFPPWCGRAAMWGSWGGIALANAVSIWAGHGFSQSMAMRWLISCFASFLCSCLLLEPIKVQTRRQFWYCPTHRCTFPPKIRTRNYLKLTNVNWIHHDYTMFNANQTWLLMFHSAE